MPDNPSVADVLLGQPPSPQGAPPESRLRDPDHPISQFIAANEAGLAPKDEASQLLDSTNRAKNLNPVPKGRGPSFNDIRMDVAQNHRVGAPLPKNIGEALRAAAERGITLKHHPTLHQDIELKARLGALETLNRMGAQYKGQFDTADFKDLTNAYRYIYTVAYSPLSPDLQSKASSEYVRTLTAKGMDLILGKLQGMQAEGTQDSAYAKKLQNYFGILKGWQSRAEDPLLQQKLLAMGARVIPQVLKPDSPAAMADLNVASSSIREANHSVFQHIQNTDGYKSQWNNVPPSISGVPYPEVIFRDLFYDINEPKASETYIKDAWSLAQSKAAVAALGLPETVGLPGGQQVSRDDISLSGAVGFTHPDVVGRIIDRLKAHKSRIPADKAGAMTPGLEKFLRKGVERQAAQAFYDLIFDQRREGEEARLKFFDPAPIGVGEGAGRRAVQGLFQNFVVPMFMQGMELTDRALGAAASGYTELKLKATDLGVIDNPRVIHKDVYVFSSLVDTIDSALSNRDQTKDLTDLRAQLAQGNFDPQTFMRVAAASRKSGLLTNLSFLASAEISGNSVASKIQRLASEAPELVSPEMVISLLTEERRKAVGEILDKQFITREEVEAADAATAKAMRNGNFWEWVSAGARSATYRVSSEMRDAIEFSFDKPNSIPLQTATGYAMKPAFAAGKTALRPVRQTVVRMAQASRARRAIADLTYFSPEHASRLGKAARRVAFDKKTPASQRDTLYSLEAHAESQLETYVREYNGLNEKSKATKRAQLPEHVRRTHQLLAQLRPETILDVFDEMGVAATVAEKVHRDTLTDILPIIVSDIAEGLKLNKRNLRPELLSASDDLAKAVDSIVGTDTPAAPTREAATKAAVQHAKRQAEALPFSLDGLTKGRGKLAQWVEDKIRSNVWDRLAITKTGVRTGQMYRSLVELTTKGMAHMKEWRVLQGFQRVNQLTALKHLRAKYRSRLTDLELEMGLLENESGVVPDDLAVRIDAYRDRLTKVEGHIDGLDGRQWDQAINLSKNDYVDDLSLQDWELLVGEFEDQGDLRAAWRRIARKGETWENFKSKYDRALADPEFDREFQNRVKKAFGDLYLNSHGLGQRGADGKLFFDVDMESGQVMLPQQARRIHRQRRSTWMQRDKLIEKLENAGSEKEIAKLNRRLRKVENEIDANPDLYDPDTNFGFERSVAPDQLKDARLWSNRWEAQLGQGILQRFADMDSGSVRDWLRLVGQTEANVRQNLYARNYLIAKQVRAYNKLPQEQKDLFNEAVELWGQGDSKSIKEFMAKNPGLFHGNLDPDGNVANLFKTSESFRASLLNEAKEVGLISQQDYDDLVGPYSPHLYEAHESRSLLSKHRKKVKLEDLTDTGETIDTSALDGSEFLSQRDLAQYRVVVKREGKGLLSEKFETEEEALAWLQETQGTRTRQKLAEGGGFGGTTELGDNYKVLKPVGLERAYRVLGLQNGGPGLFQRLSTLARDIQLHKYLKSFDRPGWTISPEEFDELRRVNPTAGREWVRLPNTRAFGPLRGKILARPLAKEMRNFFGINKDMTVMFEAIGKALPETGLGLIGQQMTHFLDNSTRWMRRFVAKNGISRNLVTLMTNYVMDMQMFGRMAFGEDFLYTLDGKLSRQFAFKLLFNSEKHGWLGVLAKGLKNPRTFVDQIKAHISDDLIVDPLDKQIVEEIRQLGVLGDQLVGELMGDDAKKEILKAIYTPDAPTAPASGPVNSQGTTYSRLKEALMVGDHPGITTLQKRVKEIDRVLAEADAGILKLSASDRSLIIEEKALKLQTIEDLHRENILRPSISSILNFAGRAAGVLEKQGLGGAAKSFSTEFYARTGNMVRVSGYHYLRRKGWSPQAAIEEINKFTQNYSGVPKAIQRLSRSPLGSAVTSFPYEMARLTKNWLTHRPFKYMALMAAIPANNMITMAAAGVDPYQAYEYMSQNSGGMPASLAFMTTPIFPGMAKGEFTTAQIPALNPMLLLRSPFGTLSGAWEREDFAEGALGDAEMAAANFASKFVAGQPLVAAGFNSLRNADPVTGRRYTEPGRGLTENIKSLVGLMVPPQTPWIGRNAQELHDLPRRPPRARTGETISKAEAALQVTTGARVRGGLIDHLAETVPGGKRALNVVTTAIARGATSGFHNPLPDYSITPKAIGKKAFFNALMWAGRRLDPGATRDFDIPIDSAQMELRTGVWHIREGQEKGDKRQVEFGKRMRDKALADLNRRATVSAKFSGQEFQFGPRRSKATGEQLPTRENTQAVLRVLDSMDISVLGEIGPIAQAFVLTRAAATPTVTQSELRKLLEYATLTESGGLSLSGDTRRIEDAIALVDDYLATRKHDRGLEQINRFKQILNLRREKARRRELRSYWTQINRAEGAAEALEGVE